MFCVALDLDVGWVTKMGIVGPYAMTKVFIDYEQYPIQCSFCLRLQHLIKDFPYFEGCKIPHKTMTLNSHGNKTYEHRATKQA
jgi:hypothetical protein